jgi:hypothetical protein
MRFVQDSEGLVKTQVITQHTLFQATVQGKAIDLTAQPWIQAHAVWAHPSEYENSHALGALIREQDTVQWIRYESVRAPGHLCAAVFSPCALRMNDLRESEQRWFCKTSAQHVLMSDGVQSFEWAE